MKQYVALIIQMKITSKKLHTKKKSENFGPRVYYLNTNSVFHRAMKLADSSNSIRLGYVWLINISKHLNLTLKYKTLRLSHFKNLKKVCVCVCV